VASGLEVLLSLVAQLDERGEEKDHVAAFVHDGRVAVVAANLAGEGVFGGFAGRVVPFKVVMSIREVDVLLMEDGRPLKWRSCSTRISTLLSFTWPLILMLLSGRFFRFCTHHAVSDKCYNGRTCYPMAYPYSTGT